MATVEHIKSAEQPTIEEMIEKIGWLNGLVRDYTSQIALMATCARADIEYEPEAVIRAHKMFGLIEYWAEELGEVISSEAREVGAAIDCHNQFTEKVYLQASEQRKEAANV